jgi:hypothetical protein
MFKFNSQCKDGGVEHVWSLNAKENLSFDHKQDTRKSLKNYKEFGYDLDLDLLVITH